MIYTLADTNFVSKAVFSSSDSLQQHFLVSDKKSTRQQMQLFHYLTTSTLFASLPATFLFTATIEWDRARQHHVDQHPQTPKVTLLVV